MKEIGSIDAKFLIEKLESNQKAISIERKIKKLILREIEEVDLIIIYGSANIQSNFYTKAH